MAEAAQDGNHAAATLDVGKPAAEALIVGLRAPAGWPGWNPIMLPGIDPLRSQDAVTTSSRSEAASYPQSSCGIKMMHQHSSSLAYAIVALCAVLVTPAADARARTADFDGNWTVLVVTEAGNCDAAYRYGVSVDNGAVRYRGESGIDVRGNVDPSGRVHVSIGRGDQRAEGTGRLDGGSGSGTWNGRSATNRCSGRWEADRR